MLYSEQAGLEITLQDKNLILPDVASRQSNVVLCIAPIWSDYAPSDEDETPTYNVITVTKGEDFTLNGLGQYATTNPLARLWKQAMDAGASVVKVIRLHGSTLEKKYMGLHNTLTMLSDYDEYDVVCVGGVFANDVMFEDFVGTDEALTLAKRNLLLTAYDVDLYVTETEKTDAAITPTLGAAGTIEITFSEMPEAGETLIVGGKTINFYATDLLLAAANGNTGDAWGVSLETDDSIEEVAGAIDAMVFTGLTAVATGASVLFTQSVVGVGNVDAATGTVVDNDHLSENVGTPADIKYIVSEMYADVTNMVATADGILEEDFSYFMGEDGYAYVVITRDGGAAYPADISITYNYIEDETTIDAIDIATKLEKKSYTLIESADIGAENSGKLVEMIGGDYVLDLSLIDDFANFNGTDIVVKNSNGEDTLADTSWVYNEGAKTITFPNSPLSWSITFNVSSSFDFAGMLASHLDTVNFRGKQILGVMALKPAINNSLQAVKSYVTNAPFLQYSKYLQIIGGPEQVFNINGKIYKDMWQGAYAGMLAVLPSYQSPLNKPIPGVIKQDYQLSSMQSLELTNKHIIVSRKRGNYVVCSDAITTAEDTSDFVAITTIRVVNDAVNLVKDIADPFIGQPNTVQMRAGMETSIKSGLEGMIKAGAITDFRFSISSTASEQLEGSMRIFLELIPVFTVRRIRVSIAVRPAL